MEGTDQDEVSSMEQTRAKGKLVVQSEWSTLLLIARWPRLTT
jgi:hypothetical protein